MKFAVCHVCVRHISSKTAEQIWLKFCTGTKVCIFVAITTGGGARGEAQMAAWRDIVSVLN